MKARLEEIERERGGRNNGSAQYSTASKSALSSGVHNSKSNIPKASWALISKEMNLIKDPNCYIIKNINEIIALKAIDLRHPLHLSSILNKAQKVPSVLREIINGWENNGQLNDILTNVAYKVGNNYPPNKDNKKGSQEIALIFNALSKLDDRGSMVNKFYGEVENSGKWQQILLDANSQDISNILNALSKINDNGTKVSKFYDKISTSGRLNEILETIQCPRVSNYHQDFS